jgi:putative ABC transport system permease protein
MVRLIFDIFGQTLQTLWGHKLRSFLTMFGIAWGVFSLLLLVGLGEGFRSGNKKQFDTLGENVMFIWSGRAPVMQGSFTALRQYYLTDRDYEDILRECRTFARSAISSRPAGRSWECRGRSTRSVIFRSRKDAG